MDLGMPEKTLIIMVKRNNAYFVPTGKTSLNVGDKLLIITDEYEMVSDALKEFAQDKERV
jgi:cell volume regulation protein A